MPTQVFGARSNILSYLHTLVSLNANECKANNDIQTKYLNLALSCRALLLFVFVQLHYSILFHILSCKLHAHNHPISTHHLCQLQCNNTLTHILLYSSTTRSHDITFHCKTSCSKIHAAYLIAPHKLVAITASHLPSLTSNIATQFQVTAPTLVLLLHHTQRQHHVCWTTHLTHHSITLHSPPRPTPISLHPSHPSFGAPS